MNPKPVLGPLLHAGPMVRIHLPPALISPSLSAAGASRDSGLCENAITEDHAQFPIAETPVSMGDRAQAGRGRRSPNPFLSSKRQLLASRTSRSITGT